ncbi:chromate transport protein [Anaerotignum neopropionicum]|uniref:Chromate transport protein n=1 Tax=Anaerotignum neopropionicum TaxID=36847 RepID=A0A136WHA3_9FIRM|nr:chromate transporter [Anaerotignum neopropionicum]KXL53911.1 chromate transport protein [Anaerotignum neopropionicum]
MSSWFLLFYEFFKIGLFSVGGGLATLPFLYKLADKYDWFSQTMVANMVAVSESTPGPLGVNMATYIGFQFGGPLGAVIATAGLLFPSVVIIIIISKFLQKFRDNSHVSDVFYMLRPAVTGLIATAGFSVILDAIFHVNKITQISVDNFLSLFGVKECILFAVILFLTNKFNKHPVFYIAIGAAIGIIFAF